jgi:hypothetical protein
MSEFARKRRPAVGIAIAALAVVAGLLAAPASASALKHSAAKQPSAAASVAKHPATSTVTAKHKASWKWTKAFNLGRVTGIKKNVGYETDGLSCPTTSICIVPMVGTSYKHPNTPAGDFYTTDPAKGSSHWKFANWKLSDYAPGDTLSIQAISCIPAGKHTDCNIAGRTPVPGSYNASYGATVFQTGTPTAANWGASEVDQKSPGFGTVSCFVNAQCAEIDDQGAIWTTAGASMTSDVSVFPADAGTSGIWWVGCAQWQQGQGNFFCAAVDQNAAGSIAWSTNPGSSDTKWTVGHIKHGTLFSVACQKPGVCIIDNDGELIATNGDTKGKSWTHSFKKITLPDGVGRTILTVDCNAKLCAVAGDSAKIGQYIAISTNPYHGHWSVTRLSKTHKTVLKDSITNVSCPTVKLCVVDNAYGQAAVGTR